MLAEPEHWEEAARTLRTADAPDEDGWTMLYFMLQAARRSYEKYRIRDIPDDIFTATMRCFSRFIGEYREMYGRYGFDRDFWTGRQLSLRLFRLGELEYEETVEKAECPSGAYDASEKCKEVSFKGRENREREGEIENIP